MELIESTTFKPNSKNSLRLYVNQLLSGVVYFVVLFVIDFFLGLKVLKCALTHLPCSDPGPIIIGIHIIFLIGYLFVWYSVFRNHYKDIGFRFWVVILVVIIAINYSFVYEFVIYSPVYLKNNSIRPISEDIKICPSNTDDLAKITYLIDIKKDNSFFILPNVQILYQGEKKKISPVVSLNGYDFKNRDWVSLSKGVTKVEIHVPQPKDLTPSQIEIVTYLNMSVESGNSKVELQTFPEIRKIISKDDLQRCQATNPRPESNYPPQPLLPTKSTKVNDINLIVNIENYIIETFDQNYTIERELNKITLQSNSDAHNINDVLTIINNYLFDEGFVIKNRTQNSEDMTSLITWSQDENMEIDVLVSTKNIEIIFQK